jgi:hypothetical protein
MHLTMSISSDEFNSVSRRIIRDAERVASTAVQRATKTALVKAREGRFKDQTGKLRAEIRMDIEGWSGSTYWGLVTSPTAYAKFVEYPTAPHEIVPKGPGYPLHWTGGKYGPGDHYAMKVQHPGTTGQKFMQAASFAAATTLRIAIREGFVGFATVH